MIMNNNNYNNKNNNKNNNAGGNAIHCFSHLGQRKKAESHAVIIYTSPVRRSTASRRSTLFATDPTTWS